MSASNCQCGHRSVVRRFQRTFGGFISGKWAIQFSTNCDILLQGIGLYGGQGNKAGVQLLRLQCMDDKNGEEMACTTEEQLENIVDGIASVDFSEPVLIRAGIWHVIAADMSGPDTIWGGGDSDRVEAYGVVFTFRESKLPGFISFVDRGQIPELYFQKVEPTVHKEEEVDKLRKEVAECAEKCSALSAENGQLRMEVVDLKKMLAQSKIGALQCGKGALRFEEREKLSKLFVTIQLENGTIIYFDNAKPFEMFAMIGETRLNAELKPLQGEYDCSFKGTIGNVAYFSASRGKNVRFFQASIVDGQLTIEQISELKTTDLILLENEPVYFIEEPREWAVYQYHENYEEMEGEKFDISGIRSIRKFECHYHRCVLYFFRENSTAILERLNEKVVLIEGPILDGSLSFYTPPHSDCIYIANSDQNALLTLDTTNLNVSQHIYDPPMESTYHSIVGVHEGILTMMFERKGVGRCLMTTKLN